MASTRIKLSKELILEVAFSFYAEPRIVDFSMNELAAKVGVSKPAIYRYFENKDAVLLGMFNKFLDEIAVPFFEIQDCRKNNPESEKFITSMKVPFSETINFFAKNPEYINYFTNQFAVNSNFEDDIKEGLIKRGLQRDKKAACKAEVVKSFYCGLTILFFLKYREKCLNSESKFASTKKFSENLVDFILGGLKQSSNKEDLVYPVEISEQRIRELDKLCLINKDEFPAEEKMFVALAKVIREYTMNGVTVERIANEMNLAKSSLYFYFDNKNQLIKSQIDRELSILIELCRENSVEAQNYSEHIYISLKTSIEYFKMRPSILPICGWLLQSSTEDPIGKSEGVNNIWEKRIGKRLLRPDFDFEVGPEILTFWIGILPVAAILFFSKHNFTSDDYDLLVKKIFNFIQFGIREVI